jgi:hypothetical protein
MYPPVRIASRLVITIRQTCSPPGKRASVPCTFRSLGLDSICFDSICFDSTWFDSTWFDSTWFDSTPCPRLPVAGCRHTAMEPPTCPLVSSLLAESFIYILNRRVVYSVPCVVLCRARSAVPCRAVLYSPCLPCSAVHCHNYTRDTTTPRGSSQDYFPACG